MKNICTDDSCFKIESLISIDERGQMVLPKDVREKAGIKPGDKMALVTWEQNGSICCISLVKSDALLGMVKKTLEPMVLDLAEK